MLIEFLKLIGMLILIILITKYLLVPVLRNMVVELNLSNKVAGKIMGISTSIPELISAIVASTSGLLMITSYNIISSNIINLILFYICILINKNTKYLKNKSLKSEILLVFVTILLSFGLILVNKKVNIFIIIFLMLLYIIFNSFNKELNKNIFNINLHILKKHSKNIYKIVLYSVLLLLIGVLLFFVGDGLENILNSLTYIFNIPSIILGIILGISTSIPEFITFFSSQRTHKLNKYIGVEEATNNLLSSNLFNLCIVESVAIIIYLMF